MSRQEPIQPSRLAQLLHAIEAPHAEWQSNELHAILQHQLAAALAPDPAVDKPATPGAPSTFRELLSQPNPPIELLRRAKDFAKIRRNQPELGLPVEIATAIYFAAIAAALVHLGTRISELSDPHLVDGFDWCRKRPWMDGALRSLMDAAATRVAQLHT